MAAPMSAVQWRAQLKKWGVNATYLPGWETRGRNHLPFAPIGVMIHHTGSGNQDRGYINWLFLTGRPAEGIPGPLAQMMTMADGRSIIGARGRANHAGKGTTKARDLVARDAAPLHGEISPGGTGTVDGNVLFYGDEVAFSGSHSMSNPQYAEAVLKTAAICDFHDWTGGSTIGHGEWTSNKWDPGQTDMARFRRDVNARLKAGPSGRTTTQEDEMPSAADVWTHKFDAYNNDQPGGMPAETAGVRLRRGVYRAGQALILIRTVAADVAGLKATVDVLAKSQGIDQAVLQKAVSDATRKALADLDLSFKLETGPEDEDAQA